MTQFLKTRLDIGYQYRAIDMDTDDLHKGASIAMANNGIDGLGDFAES